MLHYLPVFQVVLKAFCLSRKQRHFIPITEPKKGTFGTQG